MQEQKEKQMDKFELWYDVETTGLHISEGACIIQFAGILIKNGEVVEEINLTLKPNTYNRPVSIAKEALAINGYKEEDFEKHDTVGIALSKLMHMLTKQCPNDRVTLIGYNNSTFDKYFLEDWFKDQGKSFSTYFHWKQVDVFELVKGLAQMGVIEHTWNQKLGTMAEFLGVEPEGSLHDALVDVKLTRGVYNKLEDIIKCK